MKSFTPQKDFCYSRTCRFLFESGKFVTASHQFELCLRNTSPLLSQYYICFENLENLKSLIIDHWHYSMLNDSVRNSCYERSITYEVNKYIASHGHGPIVLDIGILRAYAF